MQQQYRAPDAVAAGAFTWTAQDGATFVLVDIQSTIAGLVQARADLWMVTDSGIAPVGRSDVMPSAAEVGAFAFEDLTGDGLPDLLGFVADSAGTGYPVFIPGARGAMADELAAAAPGWRFTVETDSLPRAVRAVGDVGAVPAVRGDAGPACYVQLWVEDPAPDGAGGGWRFLPLLRGGRLGGPAAAPPVCR